MRLERYFQPSSATTNTTLPSSSSPAIRTAMLAIAPLETPANNPSSSSSLRVHTIASVFVTKIFRSSIAKSMIGGIFAARAHPPLGAPAVAHQRPPRPQSRHERRHLVELFQDLDGCPVVVS